MRASLRALLTGLIDYAGLFPPAKLPLAEALANYLRYRAGADAWMLGRFLCPAAQLAELSALLAGHAGAPTIAVSALGRGGNTVDEFLAGLEADVRDIDAVPAAGERLLVDMLEVKLPAEAVHDRATGSRLLAGAAQVASGSDVHLFFEAPATDYEKLDRLLGQFRRAAFGYEPGFKLRCGGVEAPAFPPSEVVARALKACLAHQIPFKATAGLHHPFPRFDAGVKARMHGFVNLFAAGVLAHRHGIGADEVRQILDDDDPTHFAFTAEVLRWRDLAVTAEEIECARRNLVLSFGSCSFDEPREDLRALGWL